MSASPLGSIANAANYPTPYRFGQSLGSGYANSVPAPSATSGQNANFGGDQVSLSDAARALSRQNGTQGGTQNGGASPPAGSSDFSQEAQLLGGVADKALAAMGLISTADEAGAQVSFDSLTYQVSSSVSSSVSASQTQQGSRVTSQFGQQNEAVFAGAGHIVTADGRSFDFQIKLQLDESEQTSQSAGTSSNTPSGATNSASAPSASLAQLLRGDSPSALGSLFGNVPALASGGDSSSGSAGASGTQGGTSGSSGLINWDAILKQSKSLIDLLDSLAGAQQGVTGPAPSGSATKAPAAA